MSDQEREDPWVQETARATRTGFPCVNCGAQTAWEPEVDALACEYCGHAEPVPRGEGAIVERTFEEAASAAHGFGVEMRVVRCANCDARVTLDEGATASSCVYCGSASVLAQDANRNALRPESLIPLDVSRDAVGAAFRKWTHGLWFRPNAIKRIELSDAVGLYVPFWTFDCGVASHWSADAGHYYYVTENVTVIVNGRAQVRSKQVRKVRWEPAWGDRRDVYDDALVCATRGLAHELVTRLGGFDTTALVPYRPEYLAGWRAEEYRVDLEAGWEQGRHDIEARQRIRCAADIPGDTHRNLRVKSTFSDVRWKHALLPVWSLQYEFANKTYVVLVNGQSGIVTGRAPYSAIKIVVAALAVGAVLALAAVVAGQG